MACTLELATEVSYPGLPPYSTSSNSFNPETLLHKSSI
ncbi:hypothetical protein VCSRO145_3020 [Vibrio cholerae]|nr:hypothetical protein VCSRO145_3020 [Vibrio cholerae]